MAATKYPTHVKPRLKEILEWKGNGLTDEEIADNLGISRDTLINYKKRYPDFFDAIKTGKDAADCKVINAMFRRAIGYEYEEVSTVVRDGPEGRTTETRTVRKQEAPNVTAQIFWLKNRCPQDWRDRYGDPLSGKLETGDDGKVIFTFSMANPSAESVSEGGNGNGDNGNGHHDGDDE